MKKAVFFDKPLIKALNLEYHTSQVFNSIPWALKPSLAAVRTCVYEIKVISSVIMKISIYAYSFMRLLFHDYYNAYDTSISATKID